MSDTVERLGVDRGDLRLAVPAAVGWVFAAVLVGVPGAGAPAVVGTGGMLGAAVLVVLLRRGPGPGPGWGGLVATVAGLCLLVAVAVLVGDARRGPEVLRAAVGRGAVPVELVLDRDLPPQGRSVLATLVAVDGTGTRVPVRLVPAGDLRVHRIAGGARVRGAAAVEAGEPGSPTAAVVFLRGEPEVSEPVGWAAGIDRVRAAFTEVTSTLPEPGGALLRGLAIGDRSGLDPSTEAAMETSALTHLTAVSGSNCAVVVALVMVLGRAVGLPRGVRTAAAVVLLLAFVTLVRPDPSIVRATVMAVVVLLVHQTGRPVRGVPLIALAVAGMLVADPWYARSFAFALSVLATSGIVVLAPPLTALLARRLWTPVAAAVAVPVAAQLACWPVTIPLAAALPTYAVPANLLTEPLAPIVTVVGLASCVLAPVWPWGSGVLAAMAWVPATAIGAVARGAAALPWASLAWPAGVAGVLAAVGASGCAAAAVLTLGAVRLRLLLAAVAVVVIGIAVVAVPRVVLRAGVPTDWAVAACDVGQGDAVLVRDGSPDGPVALVDTGDDPERLDACLGLLGIDRVDLLVLTHFDRDHVGAVETVADRVDTALVGPTGRQEDDRVVRSLQGAGVVVRRADDTTAGSLGGLRWRVLWPRAGARDTGNDASVVLRTEPGQGCDRCVSGLFLGDLGETAQRRLRVGTGAAVGGDSGSGVPGSGSGARLGTGGLLGPVDVVKVSHHGSADQDPESYRQASAPVGLVGVGAGNTYGHPTASALRMLEDAGTTVFRTDLHGTVVVAREGAGRLRLWTERSRSAVARRIEAWPPRSPLAPPRRSTRCPGRASDRPRSCSSPVPRRSSPNAPAASCATCSWARTRRSRSTTSKPTSTHPDCSPRSRAPPCSANPAWCGSPTSRSAPTPSSPRPSRTWALRPTTSPWCCGTAVASGARSCSTRSAAVSVGASRCSATSSSARPTGSTS